MISKIKFFKKGFIVLCKTIAWSRVVPQFVINKPLYIDSTTTIKHCYIVIECNTAWWKCDVDACLDGIGHNHRCSIRGHGQFLALTISTMTNNTHLDGDNNLFSGHCTMRPSEKAMATTTSIARLSDHTLVTNVDYDQ